MNVKIAVNTITREEYREVVKWFIYNNKMWLTYSTAINEQYWNIFGPNTCVALMSNGRIAYASISDLNDSYNIDILSTMQFYIDVGIYAVENIGEKYSLK